MDNQEPETQKQPNRPKKTNPNFDDKTLKTAAYLAFFPLTGVFGIHDIVIKKYWKCIIRIVVLIAVVFKFGGGYDINIALHNIIVVVSIFAIISYSWAFSEGFQILCPINKKGYIITLPFVLSVASLSLWGGALFISLNSTGCTTDGIISTWCLAILIPIDIVLVTPLVVIFGIKGLKTKLRNLAIASLILKTISIILIARSFIWVLTLC